VVHLFERDCSAQRRHQKVIEEAPAPTVTAEVRRLLTDSAVALAAQVGYTNAGTVEFLVSGDDAYFLEMNTRLQVEHPVTESVVRVDGQPLDLVELQLRVANGEPLPFGQDEVSLAGHAFEARVYAEDAFGGFLPQAGVAETVRWSPRARVDAALESGQEVGTSYDPMLGKVIVHGPTREAARRALVTALDDSAILGLTTNLGFLRALAASEAFADCEVHTAWLDSHPGVLRPEGVETAAVVAAWAVATGDGGEPHPFGARDGWRLGGRPAPVSVDLVVADKETRFLVDLDGAVRTDDRGWSVRPVETAPGLLRVEVDGVVEEAAVRIAPRHVGVAYLGNTHRFHRPDVFAPGAGARTADGTVTAPMPGTVLGVNVEPGQQVDEGEILGIMEAMKMELSLKAPVAGEVTTVTAATGQQVALGATLFVVTPAADPA
jgi:acetyl/propionyl-CoA carboxylase alpha subunit